MATHSVERHLGLKIEDYDREIRRLVPGYDELVAEGLELLKRLAQPTARVLDLGCGTGRMSSAILHALDDATVIALDVDPKALDQARNRLRTYDDRTSFVERSFDQPLPACDAVVASLALHHVRDLSAKTAIYANIHRALPPGGLFLCLDASVSVDPVLSKATFDRWAEAMRTHGIAENTARKHFEDWAREEHYFSLHEELGALAKAGFSQPECFWRKGALAIYGGRATA